MEGELGVVELGRLLLAGPTVTSSPSPPVAPSATAKAAAVILLRAATGIAPSAQSKGAASAVMGAAALAPAASATAAATLALTAPRLLSAAGSGKALASLILAPPPQAGALANVQLAWMLLAGSTTTTSSHPPLAPAAASASAASVRVRVPAALDLAARSVSDALAPVDGGSPRRAYTFDSIVIFDSASRQVAEIARGLGPLETGHIDELGAWIPATDPVEVIVVGFGINAAGIPYYDTRAVDPGEEAALFVDPASELLWLSGA